MTGDKRGMFHGPSWQPVAFILATTDHGPMIVNRFDHAEDGYGNRYGVSYEILETSGFTGYDMTLLQHLLDLRRGYAGDGVLALDCGANLGTHAVTWCRHMRGWGSVIAIEPQERIFYALAGNLALNNCFNGRAILGAVAAEDGPISVPFLDYMRPSSFGSLELRSATEHEPIGQPVDYQPEAGMLVSGIAIDSMGFSRLDLVKLDVEGMEIDALDGAVATLTALKPILFVEHMKVDRTALRDKLLALGYQIFFYGINLLAIHAEDPILPGFTASWAPGLETAGSAEAGSADPGSAEASSEGAPVPTPVTLPAASPAAPPAASPDT